MSADWQFLIALNERLRHLHDPTAIQEVVVRLIGEHLHASRVNYKRIVDDEFVIIASYSNGAAPFVGEHPVAQFGNAIVDACHSGVTAVVSDVRTDSRFTESERERLTARQTAAFVAVPLIKD